MAGDSVSSMKKIILSALLMLSAMVGKADEGMWMLSHIDPRTAEVMKKLGLQLTPQQLYSTTSGTSLKDAVVDFGDFCSGVIVSPNGLVFTNHHCGFGNIQALSTTEHDYLKDGFVARKYSEELPAEGLFVRLLQNVEDVTARFEGFIEANDALAIDSICNTIEKEYKAKNSKLDYTVRPFYGGNAYYICSYKTYRDIRLVFTPTQTLGKFGGDTDNWMWPRQTSDFSVFRIYADKNGNPAEYSPKNKPLKVKRYAKVSLQGYQQGDYCMTIGYPGSTDRYLSSYGIEERINSENNPRIDVRGKKQDIWTRWMKSDREIYIKYASKFASSSNYWKNSIGMNKALRELGVVAEKRQKEADIMAWVRQDKERTERFDSMLVRLEQNYQKRKSMIRSGVYFNETFRGIEMTTLAALAQRALKAPSADAMASYKTSWDEFMKDYDARVDEEVMAALLENFANKVITKYQPSCIDVVRADYDGDYKAYAHDIFSQSVLFKANAWEQIKEMNDSTLSLDPAIKFYSSLMAARSVLSNDFTPVENDERLLTQAILEKDFELPHYSDANFTMRCSYGIIQDYTASGTHHNYYTNAQSLLDKVAQGKQNPDYEMEDDIANLIRKGDFGPYADKNTGEMQLCFLSNNDITGGNSGSPMFNGKGELIGLAFDGNWEAMSGDILFDSRFQRCIGVDIRYVLFLIDKWGHASNLIKEISAK